MQKFSPRQYLMFDIAGSFGLDKADWDVRLAWFQENQHRLLELMPQAEEPALYFAGIQAWEAVQRGEPIGYPISLDATASGLQILSCLIGDRRAAEICNVVNTGHRRDAYTEVWKTMQGRVQGEIAITRKQAKDAVMPSFYGSRKAPGDVFGKGTPLLEIFFETMEELCPAAWELNQYFLEIWDSEALVNEWVLPDNFHVRCKVINQVTETVHFLNEPFEVERKVNAPTKTGRSLGANTVHSLDGMIVREMTRRCSYDAAWMQLVRDLLDGEGEHRFQDQAQSSEAHAMVTTLWQHYEESGYLSARILEYIDADTLQLVDASIIKALVDSLPARPFNLISVHQWCT